jgi:hypothetical protein
MHYETGPCVSGGWNPSYATIDSQQQSWLQKATRKEKEQVCACISTLSKTMIHNHPRYAEQAIIEHCSTIARKRADGLSGKKWAREFETAYSEEIKKFALIIEQVAGGSK